MNAGCRGSRDEEAIMATKSTIAKSGSENTVVAELVLIQSVLSLLDELMTRLQSRVAGTSAS